MAGDILQGVSRAEPFTEDDKVFHRNATPLELVEKEETSEKSGIICEMDSVELSITVQSQNEEQGYNDEDLSAEDLLCFAWQIAQGMVRNLKIASRASR